MSEVWAGSPNLGHATLPCGMNGMVYRWKPYLYDVNSYLAWIYVIQVNARWEMTLFKIHYVRPIKCHGQIVLTLLRAVIFMLSSKTVLTIDLKMIYFSQI